MTVTTTANSISYAGNGVTTAFAFPYIFFAPTDLQVTLVVTATSVPVSPAPVLNGAATYDYTVTGAVTHGEYASGGTVTFNTAPLGTHTVSLVRVVPAIQTVALVDNAKFPAATINTEFDYLTILTQQAYSVNTLPTGPAGGDLAGTYPSPTIKTSVALSGNPTAPTPTVGDNDTSIATTAFVTAAVLAAVGGSVPIGPAGGDLAGTYPNPTIKAGVGLTGIPTAPTAAPATSTTQLATTAFVTAAVAAGPVLQTVMVQTGAVATGTTLIPLDDTIPQISEGNEYMTLAITPKSATSKLVIEVLWCGANSAINNIIVALFKDATANALAAVPYRTQSAEAQSFIALRHTMVSGATSTTTFRVRAGGGAAGTTTFNGASGARVMGGVSASSIVIQEVL